MSDPRIVPLSLGDHFRVFASVDDPKSEDGRKISFRNIRRWLMAADILGPQEEGGLVQFRDVQDAFRRIAKKRERIDCEQFCHMLELLARNKRFDTQVMVRKLKAAGQPHGAVSQVFDKKYDADR